MSSYNRNGFKWTVPETLRLQREYELLNLDIYDISLRHQRTPKAIAYKLITEEFAKESDLPESLFSEYRDENMVVSNVTSETQNNDTTDMRIFQLETSLVSLSKEMTNIKQLLNVLTKNNNFSKYVSKCDFVL
jgi:hypothetical protein